MDAATLLRQHKNELIAAAAENTFIVFLCGPSIRNNKRSAVFRRKLKSALEKTKFEVVLGEDDGLEEGRLRIGGNAQDNELEFIKNHCNAIIIIADSVGSFCELGLFSWHFVHREGVLKKNGRDTDCILIIDKKFQGQISYLNEGPARAIEGFGQVIFADFSLHDFTPVVRRLENRRGVRVFDNKRGRPRGRRP